MNTLCERVKEILETTGCRVFYHYPASWLALPCVSWRESANRVFARADAQEYLTELNYTIDIWSRSAEENYDIAVRIDVAMAQEGFRRDMCADLFETNTQLHHRSMRYRAVTDAQGGMYQ